MITGSCAVVVAWTGMARIVLRAKIGERVRVALPGDESGQHVPARDAEDVGDHSRSMMALARSVPRLAGRSRVRACRQWPRQARGPVTSAPSLVR